MRRSALKALGNTMSLNTVPEEVFDDLTGLGSADREATDR